MLTKDVLHCIDRSVLCWLATVDKTGTPNVSPKEVFAAHGSNNLLVADIASPNSVHNIQLNPNVCISFVDEFAQEAQKGYKLKGKAEIIPPTDARYPEMEASLQTITEGIFRINNIISVNVTDLEPILVPSANKTASGR
jgi:predicted pyridoxine 5'-phosphate oxidase superfamily flavin-nucleotide-binding protein